RRRRPCGRARGVGLCGKGTAPGVVILAAVNEEHLAICSSPEWGKFVEDDLLPWVLGGYDLGDDLLEVGPGPGLTTDIPRRHSTPAWGPGSRRGWPAATSRWSGPTQRGCRSRRGVSPRRPA